MFKKILVPLDGSSAAEAAIEMACSLARLVSGQIILVRCTVLQGNFGDPPGFPIPQEAIEAEVHYCETYLKDHAAQIREQGLVAEIQVLGSGDTASEIIAAAKDLSCQLIVLTSHGRSGMKHFLLGSVAEKICRSAPCPVMMVGPSSSLLRETKERLTRPRLANESLSRSEPA
ncbi:universal stress protein [bacterium]|nr:universal stress protein [bacterium]